MKPWRLGLTGGIASGKSTVAALFAELGVPVIDLDEVAREVVAPGTALLAAVLARFGPGVRNADGSLNRRALRDLVFQHAADRRDLEALLHPAIRTRTEERARSITDPYFIVVIPLLVESGTAAQYDRVLLVDCAEAAQRQRLAARDSADAAQSAAALDAQSSRAARRAIANDVILNDGAPAALRPQVQLLHEKYLHLAGAR